MPFQSAQLGRFDVPHASAQSVTRHVPLLVSALSKCFWFQFLVLETLQTHVLLGWTRSSPEVPFDSNRSVLLLAGSVSPLPLGISLGWPWDPDRASSLKKVLRDTVQSNVPAPQRFGFAKASQSMRDALFKSNEHLGYKRLSTWVFLSPEPNDQPQRVPQRGV